MYSCCLRAFWSSLLSCFSRLDRATRLPEISATMFFSLVCKICSSCFFLNRSLCSRWRVASSSFVQTNTLLLIKVGKMHNSATCSSLLLKAEKWLMFSKKKAALFSLWGVSPDFGAAAPSQQLSPPHSALPQLRLATSLLERSCTDARPLICKTNRVSCRG